MKRQSAFAKSNERFRKIGICLGKHSTKNETIYKIKNTANSGGYFFNGFSYIFQNVESQDNSFPPNVHIPDEF